MKKFVAILGMAAAVGAVNAVENPLDAYKRYAAAVDATAQLSRDGEVRKMADKFGLNIMNFTWEDTGRAKNSALGPNISDMSIQVHTSDGKGGIKPVLMPVVRFPNFDDVTADMSPNKFNLIVGNEKGGDKKVVSLTEYLGNFRKYLSKPEAWKAEAGKQAPDSLLAARDTAVLVSAQHTLLPVPQGQEASFNPVLFNYQSAENNAAVLAIVATREGTSATIINNKRNGFESGVSSGQRLFFNENGGRASFTATRMSDFVAEGGDAANQAVEANGESGMNMVLLIQVPLKHKARAFFGGGGGCITCLEMVRSFSAAPDIEDAVIGHGEIEGPFVEIDEENSLGEPQQIIERDDRFPIRVTVQFYKATENAVMTEDIFKGMRQQINKVYRQADYIGSLVTDGETGRQTEHDLECDYKVWWPFWKRYYPMYLERKAAGQIKPMDGVNLTSMIAPEVNPEIVLPKIWPGIWGPYWTLWCRDENKMESAMDHLLGYEAPEAEKEDQQ